MRAVDKATGADEAQFTELARVLVHRPARLVTGGQCGADSIPLVAVDGRYVYAKLGMAVAGFLPMKFKRDDGRGKEVAEEHGLQECPVKGYRERDLHNIALSDACLGFLVTKPMTGACCLSRAQILPGASSTGTEQKYTQLSSCTHSTNLRSIAAGSSELDRLRLRAGKGTMQTVEAFVGGEYSFVTLEKPADKDWLVVEPKEEGRKPAIVFWDLAEGKIPAFAKALRQFLEDWKPASLMVSLQQCSAV
jgi:hypothetical protein